MFKVLSFIINTIAVFLLIHFTNTNTFLAVGVIIAVAVINFVDGVEYFGINEDEEKKQIKLSKK